MTKKWRRVPLCQGRSCMLGHTHHTGIPAASDEQALITTKYLLITCMTHILWWFFMDYNVKVNNIFCKEIIDLMCVIIYLKSPHNCVGDTDLQTCRLAYLIMQILRFCKCPRTVLSWIVSVLSCMWCGRALFIFSVTWLIADKGNSVTNTV